MSTSTKNSTTKKVEEVKKDEAKSTASIASPTGSTVTSKAPRIQVKTSKSRIKKPDSDDDEADEDYMTYLRSRDWSRYE